MTTAASDPPQQAAWAAVEAALEAAPGVDLGPAAEDAGDWALDPPALRFVSALATALRPRHVLEFGSGASTAVLARATAGAGSAISSIDNDPEFGAATAAALAGEPRVAVQVAPLVVRRAAGRALSRYFLDRGALASADPADLVLIDGPPGPLGGREGILYQALEHARAGTVVVLDDAARYKERHTLDRWGEALGDAIELRLLPGFSKGLAAIVIARPTTPQDVR